MEITITAITGGILGLIFFFHSLRTIRGRMVTKTNLGDGGHDLMTRRIRIHGNFAEYVPLLLIMLFLLENSGTNTIFVSVFALLVIVGRLLHFYGLYSNETPGLARVLGMQFTLWPLLLGSIYLLYVGVFSINSL